MIKLAFPILTVNVMNEMVYDTRSCVPFPNGVPSTIMHFEAKQVEGKMAAPDASVDVDNTLYTAFCQIARAVAPLSLAFH